MLNIYFLHELMAISLSAAVGLCVVLMALVIYIARRGTATGTMAPDAAANLVRNIILILLATAVGALVIGFEDVRRDVAWGGTLCFIFGILGLAAGLVALLATKTRLKVGDMKSFVWVIAIFIATSFLTVRADTQTPQGTDPFAGTWSCKSDNGSTVAYIFERSNDQQWIVLDSRITFGDKSGGEYVNSYRKNSDGTWEANQFLGKRLVFSGRSAGWQTGKPWNSPALAFEGTEPTPRGKARALQTWVMDSDGTLEHVWSTYDGSNYVPTSTTYCKKA